MIDPRSDNAKECMKSLIGNRTHEGLAEALAFCMANATNKRGLRIAPDESFMNPELFMQWAQWLIDAGIYTETKDA